MLAFRIENYVKDILSWLWCVITITNIRNINLREVIESNQGHVFAYYLSRLVNDPLLSSSKKMTIREESFKRAMLFRSYNVIEVMCKNYVIEYIETDVLVKSICDLLADNIWESRQIIRILNKYDIFNQHFLLRVSFAEEQTVKNEMANAATKSTDRWALDTLDEIFPLVYTETRTSHELLEHIRTNNYGMLKAMIEYNFDIHVIFDAALAVASRNCNPKIIKLLLDNGADIKGHKFAAIKKALVYGKHEVLDMYLNASWKYIYDGTMPPELAVKLINQVAMGEEDSIEAMSLNCEATKLRSKMTKLRMQEIANVKEEA